MCGTTSSSASFDNFEIPEGGFLAKFDPDGNCQWAKNKVAWAATLNSKIRLPG